MARSWSSSQGFSLVETLVATGILLTVSLGVAQMFGVATSRNFAARQQVSTTTLATQKMEQLRGLTFAYDSSGLGLPITDTTTNLTLATPDTTGIGLDPSPSNVLEENTTNYVDYLDGQGNWVGTGTTPPSGAIFTRRWAIRALPTNPNNTLILQVLVTPTWREERRVRTADGRTRQVEDALLTSVLTRKAP
ncbi:MAG TPA: prepilin-type N-terminal cleavage/methylation domain-containing protein [Vicinamibacterales bacterium]|nr:prepilin-type N-terminal cleavage/methylation domain-containing protein [Vicinamibacterales bacterium]